MRYIAHNGEINTLRGNLNLMKAREGVSGIKGGSFFMERKTTFQVMSSSLLGDLSALYPVVEKDLSDSGSIDCSIEFLMQAGGRLALLLKEF